MISHSAVHPKTANDVAMAVADAVARGGKLEVRGNGTKANVGIPDREATILCMNEFSGILEYDPAELVLTAGAGTPLALVVEAVSNAGQMLPFEPISHGGIFGNRGLATLGGAIAAGISGPGRLAAGSARDHLLGFEAVSGRGERFVAGAKVVKNVTGFDLPKIMAGSWGRLAVLTQVTLKVLPRPRVGATMVIRGLSPSDACGAMTAAMRSQAEVSAAAHISSCVQDSGPITAFKLRGFQRSVDARLILLHEALRAVGSVEILDSAGESILWDAVRDITPLADCQTIWRISVPPSECCNILKQLPLPNAKWLLDWAGGLIWLPFDGNPAMLRAVVSEAGGHAMLVRGSTDLRKHVSALHPEKAGVSSLSRRVRNVFDPAGVFETGRFLD